MDYKFYNKFQYSFFTNIRAFNQFSNYEINQNVFLLFNALTKVFPTLVKRYMYYNRFLKFNESPSLIKALQHKFVNNFVKAKVPQEVYFKNAKKSTKKSKIVKTKKSEYIEFSDYIVAEICSKLFIDNKTYNNLKYSDKIQKLGSMLVNEYEGKLKNLMEKSTTK